MRGNFSRLVLQGPRVSRVLQQQGRVLLDADWNDAIAVLLDAQRAFAADVVGPHGGPQDRLGFAVSALETNGRPDLAIGRGVYYVDGIRVELPGDPDEPVPWSAQPYPPWTDLPELPAQPYLVYLDVWERHHDAIQDDTMREVGLGGPDTTSRAEVVWQVRTMPAGELNVACADFPLEDWRRSLRGTPPRLRAWVHRDDDDDPCMADPDAGYRGVENQLYRVEITDVEGDQARFLWSRENGSVSAAWVDTEDDRLVVEGLRDRARGFAPRDWVELTWDELELAGEPGPRVRVVAVDARGVTYDEASATAPVPADPRLLTHPVVRRWDARPRSGVTLHGGAITVAEGNGDSHVVRLEDGIEVQFAPPEDDATTTTYRVGDYWTIPARVATGSILWPTTGEDPDAVPPHGVEHHYAPLAIVGDTNKITGLRHTFTTQAIC